MPPGRVSSLRTSRRPPCRHRRLAVYATETRTPNISPQPTILSHSKPLCVHCTISLRTHRTCSWSAEVSKGRVPVRIHTLVQDTPYSGLQLHRTSLQTLSGARACPRGYVRLILGSVGWVRKFDLAAARVWGLTSELVERVGSRLGRRAYRTAATQSMRCTAPWTREVQ